MPIAIGNKHLNNFSHGPNMAATHFPSGITVSGKGSPSACCALNTHGAPCQARKVAADSHGFYSCVSHKPDDETWTANYYKFAAPRVADPYSILFGLTSRRRFHGLISCRSTAWGSARAQATQPA